MKFNEKVYDKDFDGIILLDEQSDGLKVFIDESEHWQQSATAAVVLSDSKVRELRLALTRYERGRANQSPKP